MSEEKGMVLTATQQMMRERNARNRFQGPWPRVLCVCSAGLLRSPTLAWVLANPPYNCNTRAAGTHPESALVLADQVLIDWARYVVFVNRENFDVLAARKDLKLPQDCYILDVPDRYEYRDADLVVAIRAELESAAFPLYVPYVPKAQTHD